MIVSTECEVVALRGALLNSVWFKHIAFATTDNGGHFGQKVEAIQSFLHLRHQILIMAEEDGIGKQLYCYLFA